MYSTLVQHKRCQNIKPFSDTDPKKQLSCVAQLSIIPMMLQFTKSRRVSLNQDALCWLCKEHLRDTISSCITANTYQKHACIQSKAKSMTDSSAEWQIVHIILWNICLCNNVTNILVKKNSC